MITFHRLSHVGTRPFRRPIEVNFGRLGHGVSVAISGPNWAGKTTFLDLIPGALYLTMPFRPGALLRHFYQPGHITLTWEYQGQTYTSVVKVDPSLNKTEAWLRQGDATGPVLAGPKQAEYLGEMKQRLPVTLDLFTATAYAVQPSYSGARDTGAFLRASRADRKALLTELLGLERYRMWQAAGKARVEAQAKRLDEIEAQRVTLEGLLKDEDRLRVGLAQALEHLKKCEGQVTVAEDWLASAEEILQGKRAAAARLDGVLGQARTLEQRRQSLRTSLKQASAQVAETRAALTKDQEITTEAPAIQAAAGQVRELEQRMTLLMAALDGTLADYERAMERYQTWVDYSRAQARLGLFDQVPCHGEGIYAACPYLTEVVELKQALPDPPPEPMDKPVLDTTGAVAERERLGRELTQARAVAKREVLLASATERMAAASRRLGTLTAELERLDAEYRDTEQAAEALAQDYALALQGRKDVVDAEAQVAQRKEGLVRARAQATAAESRDCCAGRFRRRRAVACSVSSKGCSSSHSRSPQRVAQPGSSRKARAMRSPGANSTSTRRAA